MILPQEGNARPNLTLGFHTYPLMVQILRDGFLYGHGLARKDNQLYRRLKQMRAQGLIRRQGYKYYPTRFGWMAYFRVRRQVQLTRKEAPGKPWKEIFKTGGE